MGIVSDDRLRKWFSVSDCIRSVDLDGQAELGLRADQGSKQS